MSDNKPGDLYELLARSLGGPTLSESGRHGIDVERLMPEIAELRDAARRFGQASDAGTGTDDAGGTLEIAAVRYANKLDKELYEARRPNYAEIFERARREQERREN